MVPRRLAFFCLLVPVAAQTPEQSPAEKAPPRNVSGGPLLDEQACFDVQHYDLAIKVQPDTHRIDGVLTMRAKALASCASIALDLDGALGVTAVTVDGAPADFRHEDGRIWIAARSKPATGSEFTVAVTYGGEPHVAPKPPWEGGFTWAKTKTGEPWIATSCQGEGADLWWPCKDQPGDKPDSVDLHVTVPKGLVVASNGVLHGKPVTKDGWTTFDWHEPSPISNYCVALNIAPYVCVEDTYTSVDGTKVPVQFYALPENEQKARRILPQFLDHVRCFEEILGPYPFRKEKYGIAETPHLGMEHQTIIAYGNKYRDMKYDWLHNHELSHEWWGNLITCRDWKDMWLHEGFGTYMQPLYLERRRDRAAYDLEMKKDAHFVNRVPVAPREHKDSQEVYFDNGGSNDIYFKGAWVLHTLRWELGDDQFFACLRRFCYPTDAQRAATDGSQVRLVDTDDFVALCSEVAGRDLRWFFEVYVRQPALPRLRDEVKDGVLHLEWQLPAAVTVPFELAVPVTIGDKQKRVAMPGGKGELRVGTADYEIDAGHLILMGKRVE